MLKFHRGSPARALSTIVFGLGLMVGAVNAQAGDDASAHELDKMQNPALASSVEGVPSGHQPSEPFGAVTSVLVKGGLQSKWTSVKRRLPRQHNTLTLCRASAAACPPAAKRFLAILDRAQAQEGWVRIAEINRAINLDIRPVDDMTQYGVLDLWATPLTTFASNAGDCEDYAIAKYFALREIGIAEDDLRLVVVRDRRTSEDHAVAAVRYDGRWLILDNRTLDMRQDVDIAEFEALFVIDREGARRMATSAPNPPNRLASVGAAKADLHLSSGRQTTPLLL
jgi:predicted transglutaminase-like cysteine proteinase